MVKYKDIFPLVTLILYSVNVLLVKPRIGFFIGVCWSTCALSIFHALMHYSNTLLYGLSDGVLIVVMVMFGGYSLFVVIAQLRRDIWLALRHLVLFSGALASLVIHLI